ncbi:MAG: 4Fe-4S binding protein [Tannerellaceae bacterium]|jgi:NAD-dependent dihydropyrimidine dehydrogenase PreA subunit|nr:4Fe-4S binding protein [Tannerellaceae bacterium]
MSIVYWIMGVLVLLWVVGGIHRRKRRGNRVIRVLEANCTGCQACLRRCSHRVLEAVRTETATSVVVRHPELCTACGHCMEKCKFKALEWEEGL